MEKDNIWKKLFRLMPKKRIVIEGNIMEPQQEKELEILEGEETPIRVYFDKDSEYEIIEQEITPARIPCPGCGRIISHGMDYCNWCGCHVTELLGEETR